MEQIAALGLRSCVLDRGIEHRWQRGDDKLTLGSRVDADPAQSEHLYDIPD